MTTRSFTSLLVATLATACATGADDDGAECFDGKCDDTNGGVCTDERYGDGTCNTDIACTTPDIDCFTTYADDAEATQWFASLETQLATHENRAARTLLPATDPRHVKLRALVDRGWDAFKATRPVGKLAEFRPGLVMIEDPAVNAFAGINPETGRSSHAIVVQTGALAAGLSEEAVLGVIMHELQHAIGLHMLPGVKDKLVRYYVARDSEPIGRIQPNDPQVQAFASQWLDIASEIGSYSDASFGGYPMGGTFSTVLTRVITAANQQNPAGCARALALYNSLSTDLANATSKLTGEIAADRTALLTRSTEMMLAVRDECLAGSTQDLIAVLAAMSNMTYAAIEAQLAPADVALIKNQHVINGIGNITIDRRTKLRGIEAAFQQQVGVPFQQLRYFSYEEDADDVSVPVMRASGMSPTSLADFFLGAGLAQADAVTCAAQIAAGQVPHYGVDIADAHHSVCWRVHHVHAVARWSERSLGRMPASAPVIRGYRIELPPTPADMIMD